MREEIKNPYPGKSCFFCGSDNARGLKLKFYLDTDKQEVSTEYLPHRHFAGQGDILHGAIQMGLLDEIMGWTCYVFTRKMAVTSDISIKFHRPAYICDQKLDVRCRIRATEGPKVTMTAILSNSIGEHCTTAEGSYHLLSEERYQKLITAGASSPRQPVE